eukprot:8418824-Lingulodinium_polyedra.AAC.1
MFCSPTRVQKARLPVVVHVVPCPISGDPLLVLMSARAPVSAHVGIPHRLASARIVAFVILNVLQPNACPEGSLAGCCP